MFNERTPDKTFEYISCYDPAVKDDGMSVEEVERYAKTADISIIKPHLVKGKTPCRFHLAEVGAADKRYIFGGDLDGEPPEEKNARIDAAIAAIGIRGWDDPPEGAPPWKTRKVGFRTLVSEEILDFLGPEVGAEIAAVLWIRTLEADKAPSLEEDVEKN